MLNDILLSIAFMFGASMLMHFTLYRHDNAHDFAYLVLQAIATGFFANSILVVVLALCIFAANQIV